MPVSSSDIAARVTQSLKASLLRRTSVHEAAHCVLPYRLQAGGVCPSSALPPGKPALKATALDGGHAMILVSGREAEAIMLLAGNIAPALYGDGVVTVSSTDGARIEALAHKEGGDSSIRQWTRKTLALLHEPAVREAIFALADELERKREMSSREVDSVLSPWIRQWTPQQGGKTIRIIRARAGARKTFDVVKAGGRVTDYRNVRISGYLSTFGGIDRDGETVAPGAFKETIPGFLRNPVLLVNHENMVQRIAGTFTELKEDQHGLFFEARLSDSDTAEMRHVRALVAEGYLRTTSMGGRFHYGADGRTIEKVELFEGSLVAVPANPEALFAVIE